MSKKKPTFDSNRRDLLTGTAAVAGLAALGSQSAKAQAQTSDVPDLGISAAQSGVYETVDLAKRSISVAAIQSRVRSVDVNNLKATTKENLDHAVRLINYTQGAPEAWGGERRWGGKVDLICMHEFPLQGFQPWTRDELYKVAYDLPGPEVNVIAERAKHFGCYIAFGCYARDPDWPRHVINMSVIVGPEGTIVSKQWKARNILGLFGENALIGTTVYNVLDRYVEMYGWDATLPVARLPIGNIAMTAVGMEPMIYQCLALKGAEVLIMSVTGGSNAESAIATARNNRIYTVGVGNAVSPDNTGFMDAAGAKDEGTVIVDPRGQTIGKTSNQHEDLARSRIPIGDFRDTRSFREVPAALIMPVLQAYQPAFQPNAFLDRLPETYKEAGSIIRGKMKKG